MDPVTAFAIATLLILANGGVLGLMHRDLPATLRPAAMSWRIATLMLAAGCILFVAQPMLPPALGVPLSNGLVMLGLTGYWHALRQFYGFRDAPLLVVPAALATVALLVFATVFPSTGIRIAIVTVVWLFLFGGAVRVLHGQAHRDSALSRRVLAFIFLAVAVFTAFRGAYFVWIGIHPQFSVLDAASWMNLVTPMIAALLPVTGTTAFLLMCSERIRRQWERAASMDALTGLANRRTLTESGTSRFEATRGTADALAVVVVDIDHFKAINDRHGHAIGDVALRHVAERLEASCRRSELPARMGGEEFVVLLDGANEEQARAAGERLRRAVESQPFVAGELAVPITVSIGVAVQRADDGDFDALLRRADDALYAAKRAGRNRVQLAA